MHQPGRICLPSLSPGAQAQIDHRLSPLYSPADDTNPCKQPCPAAAAGRSTPSFMRTPTRAACRWSVSVWNLAIPVCVSIRSSLFRFSLCLACAAKPQGGVLRAFRQRGAI